jgi:hypothetical protein
MTQVERNLRYRKRLRAARLRTELKRLRRDPALRAMPERDDNDFWPTPPDLIATFIQYVLPGLPPDATIWEMAAGNGVLADAIAQCGRQVVMSNVDSRRPDIVQHDFINEPPEWARGSIGVTNPPFPGSKNGKPFFWRALELVDNGFLAGLVLLQRAGTDATDARAEAFDRTVSECRCCWRPRWIEGSKEGPRWWFSWFVWRPGWNAPPTVQRIRKRSLRL